MDVAGTQTIWWRRRELPRRARGAFKTALAATFCLWLGHLFGLAHSYWAAISAIVVMSGNSPGTLRASIDRLIGTAVGALLGWGTFYVWHGHYVAYGAAVMLCLFVCSLLDFDKAGRLAGVALTIVVLVHMDGTAGQAALSRFLEVSLGIIVALIVTDTVFPESSSKGDAPRK